MNTNMREFFNRSDIFAQPEITIGVTDSGLGGLSTTADLVRRLRENWPFSQVRVVFFNALFANFYEGCWDFGISLVDFIHG